MIWSVHSGGEEQLYTDMYSTSRNLIIKKGTLFPMVLKTLPTSSQITFVLQIVKEGLPKNSKPNSIHTSNK